jgi:hypothetical protein
MADTKLSALPAVGSVTTADVMYLVQSSTSSKATVAQVGAAILASPALTGTPTAPTATTGDDSTTVATTAFVTAAVASGGGGTTIGGSVSGGTDNAMLYVDASGDLADAGPTWTASTSTFAVPNAMTAAAVPLSTSGGTAMHAKVQASGGQVAWQVSSVEGFFFSRLWTQDGTERFDVNMVPGGAGGSIFAYDNAASSYLPMQVQSSDFSVQVATTGSQATAIEANTTGIGLNGATPVAKGTISGSKSDGTALASLLTYLASRGDITDSTT